MTNSVIKLTLFFLFFLIPFHANAASVGLSIDPSLLRVQIKPGKSITKSFTIENTDSLDKNLVARIVPFNKADPQGNPELDVKQVAPWMTYFGLSNANIKLNEPFVLKSNSKEQIIISIAIPETANIEDIYATLLVSTYDNNLENNQEGTLISATIGSNLLISITSQLNPTTILKIEKITITEGSYIKIGKKYFADNLSPLKFTAIANNDGQHLTETKGTFRVTNRKNSEVLYMQGILPQNVIAKTKRNLLSVDEKQFAFKPSLYDFGNYTISFDIKTDNTNTSNSIDIYFFPFKASITFLVAIFLIRTITASTKGQKPVEK